MFKLILICAIALCGFSSFSQNGPSHIVYFDVDSYSISVDEQKRFASFSEKVDWEKSVSGIRLYGHTDSDANNAYNETLSKNRVSAVKDLLTNNGINIQCSKEWFGEEKPLNENKSAKEKQQNRRVEIRLDMTPGIVEEEGDIKDLYRILEQKKQSICIDPKGDTTIRLDQGTIIYIPENAFGKMTGNCIDFKAKEFYKLSDMIMENLSTTSNGTLLETEGMIYLEASYDGNPISLAPGKELTVFMPTDSLREDIGLFSGQRDEHSDIMNWLANNASNVEGIRGSEAFDCLTLERDRQMNCDRCKLFFCRFKRFGKPFQGMVNRGVRSDNRRFRKCQRALRRVVSGGSSAGPGLPDQNACERLDSLFKVYGVSNHYDLMMAMNKEKMEELGVTTLEELRDTLNKIKLAQIEGNIASGTVSKQDMDYYMFNTRQLGWINLDAFSKLDGPRAKMETTLPVRKSTDCKAVFKRVRGILPAHGGEKTFAFHDVPMGHPIWLIGLKYQNGETSISIVSTKSKRKTDDFDFQKVSINELKQRLKQLDR